MGQDSQNRSEMPHTIPTLSSSKPFSPVGWRSIAIGLILIPVNCYWITYIELVQYSAQPTIVSLIFTVVFNVLVLKGVLSGYYEGDSTLYTK